MSNLENTIEEVMMEANAPVAKTSSEKPDPDAEKKASDAADKAGDATSKAKAPGGDKASEKGGEVKDGETKVEKGKAVNQEEVESDEEAISEMGKMEGSKSEMLKAMVSKMKEMGMAELKAAWNKMEMNDMDGDKDEQVESLSRNALIRSVVENLKDSSTEEVAAFIESMEPVEEGELPPALKKAIAKKKGEEVDEMEDEDEDEDDKKENVKKESYDIDMSDDIEALVSDEDLSEDFKSKAKTIFEAAVSAKVKELSVEKEAQLEEELNTKVEEIKDDLTEKVDSYLNYVSENWVTENELAIERGLKSELTEDFINGLKRLFEEHYVEVPEDKFDVVEELANRLDEMEDKLNEEVASNISAQQDIEELQREKIISEASNDLADTQVEKLKALSEDVDFESVENFVEKVSTLKESYFGIEKVEAVSDDSAVVSEDADFSGAGDVAQPVNEGMSQYTAALTKFAKINTTQK
jgi:hypothetical protein|tara:strand:- start:58 stop:1464 length:1407 start_codon:yes stop_codon:yes gene_type:complete